MSPRNRKRNLIGMALLCVGALAGTQAFADPHAIKTIRVKYTPEDVARPDAAGRLYARIQAAARQACSTPDIRELQQMRDYQSCYERAVDLAVSKVDAPALTAVHQNRQHSATG